MEAALAAAQRDDFQPFEDLLEALSKLYENRPGFERYAVPPVQTDHVYQTFCGT